MGVAVADSPTGPFGSFGVSIGRNRYGDIDPTVFIDDDGQAYLYWGNPYLWYVKLNEDMISYDQEVGIVQVPLTPQGFGHRVSDDPKRPTLYEEGPGSINAASCITWSTPPAAFPRTSPTPPAIPLPGPGLTGDYYAYTRDQLYQPSRRV